MIRKITSKQDDEKKKKRNQITVGVVLVLIMIMSTLGYSIGTNSGDNSEKKINYNGYDFTYLNGFWVVNISGSLFGFANNPNDAYQINSTINPISDYSGKTLYLYSENSDAESEIYRNLYYTSGGVVSACPEGTSCDVGIPAKNCTDNFIIIKEKETAAVSQDNGCVYIEGNSSELTKITDGFLLKIMGIQ